MSPYVDEINRQFQKGSNHAEAKVKYITAQATKLAWNIVHQEGPKLAIICPTGEEMRSLEAVLKQGKGTSISPVYDAPLGGLTRSSSLNISKALIPRIDKKVQEVILCYAGDQGVAPTAYAVTALLKDFPLIKHVILCGIAASVPHPLPLETDPKWKKSQNHQKSKWISDCSEHHLGLGDIGIGRAAFQFDFGKVTPSVFHRRDVSKTAGREMMAISTNLFVRRKDEQPWMQYLNFALKHLKEKRPDDSTDMLYDWKISTTKSKGLVEKRVGLPRRLPERMDADPEDGPNIRIVKIGTSNAVLKDPNVRDHLWNNHQIGAIEMEGAAAADAVSRSSADFLIVRGISDYASPDKSDEWWNYAAIAAGAFTRCVAERLII